MIKIKLLREANEYDLLKAVDRAHFGSWPQDEAALLDFFNLMIDTLVAKAAPEDCSSPAVKEL